MCEVRLQSFSFISNNQVNQVESGSSSLYRVMSPDFQNKTAICFSGILLGEIVKNLSRMAVVDPGQRLKLMMLSAVSTDFVLLPPDWVTPHIDRLL